jgi:hypothetical protein
MRASRRPPTVLSRRLSRPSLRLGTLVAGPAKASHDLIHVCVAACCAPIGLLLLVGALALAGCGTKTVSTTNANGQVSLQTVPNVHFAKTEFVLHMALAFGASSLHLQTPAKWGAAPTGPGRVKLLLKGAAAAVSPSASSRSAHAPRTSLLCRGGSLRSGVSSSHKANMCSCMVGGGPSKKVCLGHWRRHRRVSEHRASSHF